MAAASLEPTLPVRYLKGVGPRLAARLAKLEIKTVADLVYHFPSRYLDFRRQKRIADLTENEVASLRGRVLRFDNYPLAGQRSRQRAIIDDGSGRLELIWFNQPFQQQNFPPGRFLVVAGEVKRSFRGGWQIINPYYEAEGKARRLHTQRLVPIYPETQGVSSRILRNLIGQLFSLPTLTWPDYLLPEERKQLKLLPRQEALRLIHFPPSLTAVQEARRSLAFEEILLLQLPFLWQQQQPQAGKSPQLKINYSLHRRALALLPYQLTTDQQRAIEDIFADIKAKKAMNRLLEGDVGSGKTIVAALVAVQFLNQGYQVALMVPTEILAWQHYQSLRPLFNRLKMQIGLLTSSRKKNLSTAKLFIGTQALFQKDYFNNLGLVIIDEQHRFGVQQRAKLISQARGKWHPHVLTMTATPIPRTVHLFWRGDLAISRLYKLLPGRKPVTTYIVPREKRAAAYRWLATKIKKEHCQAFIICPFIEPSETLQTVKAAKLEFQRLQKIFPQLRLALLHGRCSPGEKEKVLAKMQRGQIDILIATPVVEVGIDLPRANIMVIENAERFGLAQLHQLRGRVGRNQEQAYCLLFNETNQSRAKERLQLLTKLHQGLALAEADLKLRGPGEVFGYQQHGFPRLKIASWTDLELVKSVRRLARQLLQRDPKLEKHPQLRHILDKKMKTVALN